MNHQSSFSFYRNIVLSGSNVSRETFLNSMKNKRIKYKNIILAVILIICLSLFTKEAIYRNNIYSKLSELPEYNKSLKTKYLKYIKKYENAIYNDVIIIVNNGVDSLEYSKNIVLFVDGTLKADGIQKCLDYYSIYESAKIEDVKYIVANKLTEYDYSEDISYFIDYYNFDNEKSGVIEKCVVYKLNNSKCPVDKATKIVEVGADDHEYSNSLAIVVYDKYFLISRLDRYIAYCESSKSNNARNVVSYVNCDRDMKEYEYFVDTDLSQNELMIVNKYNCLSADYVPENLVTVDSKYSPVGARLDKVANDAFVIMCEDALKEGYKVTIYGDNGYRSYEYQQSLFNNFNKQLGEKTALRRCAKPGFSEHQTGLALDLTISPVSSSVKFNWSDLYRWAIDNSWKYGFIYRYQGNTTNLTGYQREDWHYRYVGVDVATQIHEENITYDEYYTYYILGK